jgi:prolyl oligopeptidase
VTASKSYARSAARLSYPPAERLDIVERLGSYEVADPYRWLEDASDPRTIAWSEAEDELFAEQAAGWPGRERFAARVRELLSAGVVGVPIWRGDRRFFVRREGTQEHGVLLTVDQIDGGDGAERVLVDPVALDPTGLTTLDAWQPSMEGDLLAYQLSEGGTEESVLRVLDVATGEQVEGPIDRARYSPVAWLPGGEGYYYVRRLDPAGLPEDERQYHRRVWFHRVGADPATDAEIFGAGLDFRSYYGVAVSRDGRWLTLSAATGTAPRNDAWIAPLVAADGSAVDPASPALTEVAVGLDAHVGTYVGRDGRLYVATDLAAPRGRLAVTSPSDPGPDTWRDLLPQDPEAVLEDYVILDGPELADRPLLVASWTRHAVSEITAHELATGTPLPGPARAVPLPGLGSVGGLVGRPEGGHEMWFTYTDHTTLPHVYRYDGRDGSASLFSSPPGVVESVPEVVTRQVAYTSQDGTTVRMFVLARADAVTGDGSRSGLVGSPRPAILYGYGGFGVPLAPGYSASILAWVEAGGVYAVANLRGGSEEGEAWHRAGMLGEKHHVFEDFHAAAEKLVADGWTTSEQLSISGGSNGGLLVGVALTQRPELYAAVTCSAPLLDMVRYERFGLGATWNVEYGSADDPEQLGWLLSYSPYHHVRGGARYPAVLFTVFDGDTRVDPLHARKMCAALQHATSDDRPILLRREKDVGHGARALSRSIDLTADTLAFTARWTGLPLAD